MVIVHLTASTFFGGPERQMLGLARALGDERTVFLSFPEDGRAESFVAEAKRQGFEAQILPHDTPRLGAAIGDIRSALTQCRADVLVCHGYKAGLLGRIAARRLGIPAVAVSRGWTAESPRVRLYELLDRINLRFMDRIVCVSEAQAAKVRTTGAAGDMIHIIRNAMDIERLPRPEPTFRGMLHDLFPKKREWIIGAAGRLSPEKGFGVLVDAARIVLAKKPGAGFVVFGDGALRESLTKRITGYQIDKDFVLAGFDCNLDHYMPWFDVLAIPSFTEGLPNVALEALAAGVPVVATAVGGTPEVVESGRHGLLTPAGDPERFAARLLEMLESGDDRRRMGEAGRQRVRDAFTFEEQGRRYQELFRGLMRRGGDDVTNRPVSCAGAAR